MKKLLCLLLTFCCLAGCSSNSQAIGETSAESSQAVNTAVKTAIVNDGCTFLDWDYPIGTAFEFRWEGSTLEVATVLNLGEAYFQSMDMDGFTSTVYAKTIAAYTVTETANGDDVILTGEQISLRMELFGEEAEKYRQEISRIQDDGSEGAKLIRGETLVGEEMEQYSYENQQVQVIFDNQDASIPAVKSFSFSFLRENRSGSIEYTVTDGMIHTCTRRGSRTGIATRVDLDGNLIPPEITYIVEIYRLGGYIESRTGYNDAGEVINATAYDENGNQL